jgi:hypothetical protein
LGCPCKEYALKPLVSQVNKYPKKPDVGAYPEELGKTPTADLADTVRR